MLAERVPPLLHRPGSRARRVIGRRAQGGSGYWDEHAKLAGRGYQPTEREREIMEKARREADVASGSEGGAPGDRSNEIPGMTDRVTTDDDAREEPPPTTTTKTGAKNQDGVEAVPGEPLSDQVIESAPGWPTRLLYSAWRQQPGVGGGAALMPGLVKHCGEVKAAADEWGLGGSCDVTIKGAITGTAEGSAYNVAEFTKWIIKSFHAHEFGDSPTLLGPDVSTLDTEFSAPTSPEDYPDGYRKATRKAPTMLRRRPTKEPRTSSDPSTLFYSQVLLATCRKHA